MYVITGNKVIPSETSDADDGKRSGEVGELLEVTFVSVPKDSDLDDEEVDYNFDGNVPKDDELVVRIPFDEEGDYKLRAKLVDFGKYITLTVTAKEAGETEDIVVKFKKDGQKSLIAGEFDEEAVDSLVLDVKLVDEFGIEIDAEDYKAFSSDVSLVKIAEDGVQDGKLTIEGPKDDKNVE